MNLSGKFKAYVKGKYSYTGMATDKLETGQETTFSYFLAPQWENAKFGTRVIFYRAKDGYEVLDYQAEPGQTTAWDYYNKPDPAFILPWYGFPGSRLASVSSLRRGSEALLPQHHHQSDACQSGPDGDHLGHHTQLQQRDRHGVKVRFFQGDPDNNIVIGEEEISSLARPSGPKEVAISWQATGVGKQRIYAVIDPDGAFDEVHDEDDLINNNTAYGLVQLGATAYGDMGLVADASPYDAISYDLGNFAPTVSLYVPRASLTAVARFEVGGAETGLPVTNSVFEAVAYQGSSVKKWSAPIPGFSLQPESGDPPAAITVHYSETDIGDMVENELKLYRLDGSNWVEATCAGYEVHRFPEDNLIVVPVCQTGTFALSDRTPVYVSNEAPNPPSSPSPPGGALNVPITSMLEWQGGDPDGDPVTYDIALGTADPPSYVATTTLTQYAPDLRWGKTYYWRISASDGISTTVGPTWHFSTMEGEDTSLPLIMRWGL